MTWAVFGTGLHCWRVGAVAACVSLTAGCSLLLDDIRHEVTTLDGAKCTNPLGANDPKSTGPIEVYWGPELPSRAFTRIAHIEVVGDRSAKTRELLAELRQQALACHATALIGVEKRFSARAEHAILSDDVDVVSQNILTGVAIRYDDYPPTPTDTASSIQGWDE